MVFNDHGRAQLRAKSTAGTGAVACRVKVDEDGWAGRGRMRISFLGQTILSHRRQPPASRAPGLDQAPQDAYFHGARVRRVGNAAVGPLRNGEGGARR